MEVTSAERSEWDIWKTSTSKPKKADIFGTTKQLERETHEVVGGKYATNSRGEIKIKETDIMDRRREYFSPAE